MYRQDYAREKPLRKWDLIGELVRRAFLAGSYTQKAALTLEILAYLNEEEMKAIAVTDEELNRLLKGHNRLDSMERRFRKIRLDAETGRPQIFVSLLEGGGKPRLEESSEDEFYNQSYGETYEAVFLVGRILRRIVEFCESKGVRVGFGVGVRGPRGAPIGVSKIIARETEFTQAASSSGQEETRAQEQE